MPFDRRITNGLAWAGAFVVVAIPAADVALRQMSPQDAPQVAVVETQVETPALPTPVSQRPAEVVAETPAPAAAAPAGMQKPAPAPAAQPTPATDTVTTAAARPASNDAVDDFLNSGRTLPSYISDGGTAAAAPKPAAPAAASAPPHAKPVTSAPGPAASPAAPAEQVAALPRTKTVTFPTPVSERPPSVPAAQVATQPPLVIDTAPGLGVPTRPPVMTSERPPVVAAPGPSVITASDLEDWESGPLSEFLARRQGGSTQPVPDYDADGFFLDEGPNSGTRVWRFPQAYEDGYYPFQ